MIQQDKCRCLQEAFSAQIQPGVSRLIGKHFVTQQDSELKHMVKETKELFMVKRRNTLDWLSSHLISILVTRLKVERSQQTRAEGG